MTAIIEKQFTPPKGKAGLRNYQLIPYTVMVNRPGKAPYFSTRWKKADTVHPSGGSYINIIPVANYQNEIEGLYEAWRKYVNSFEEKDHAMFLPLIALQEIIYKEYKGILAGKENRIIGVVSLKVDEETNESRISIISASPYDIKQGNEDKIEDALKSGIKRYAESKKYDLMITDEIEKSWDLDRYIDIIKNDMKTNIQQREEDNDELAQQVKQISENFISKDDNFDDDNTWIEKAKTGLIPKKVPVHLPSGKTTHGIRWVRPEEGQKSTPSGIRIPPNWTDVWVTTDKRNPLQATGVDTKGRKQYLYSSKHVEKAAAAKFKRLKDFHKALPILMKRIKTDMDNNIEEAQVLFLISQTGLRVGSEKETLAEKKAYGATTLLSEHISIDGDNIAFDFTGKKGIHIQLEINNPELSSMLKQKIKQSENGQLFGISDNDARKYLNKIVGSKKFTPKDFRTWLGTSLALEKMEGMERPGTKRGFQRARKAVGEFVSSKLGNTPAMALSAYIDKVVFAPWEEHLAQEQAGK